MPHHAVVREPKERTKVRIVYDASSRDRDRQSLNDCLDSGPNLNLDLLRIILRFRYHPIAFSADIQRAFLEIGIVEKDRKFLQFLWKNEGGTKFDFNGHDIRILQMTCVPSGVKCSLFILTGAIRLHLKKYKKSHSEAYSILKELYVDDLIIGASTVEEAVSLARD
ncbi:uncharacterized protein LOC118206034 [Stegodyphus dumicola]|uniref:uncharacterized protein LOC118206034 n=1 Tax=Stegodyphus dumicola TaxID=202533 RepID=UPI0015A8EB02|nr:uncharacterized protein LOC118206034 [Stegodyphus dumicola]